MWSRWLGLNKIQVFSNGAVQLETIDKVKLSLLVNGHRIKLYKKPLEHDDFIISLMDEYGAQSSVDSRFRTQDDVTTRNELPNTSSNAEIELHNSTFEITQA